MSSPITIIRGLLLVAASLMVATVPAAAQFLVQESSAEPGLVDKVHDVEIDWGKEVYVAMGRGAMPPTAEESNRSKAYLKAQGYAKMNAIANLLMAIEESPVSCRNVWKDYITKDPALGKTVEEHLADAEIVAEKQQAEGSETLVVVKIQAPMYGAKGIASALLKSKPYSDPALSKNPPDFAVNKADTPPAIAPTTNGPFTSLIVDCTGVEIDRAVAPKLRRADGSEVWGALPVKADFLKDHGIVAYAPSLEEAKRATRTGASPFVVKAIGRAGGKFKCDAVISDADADRAVSENKTSHFLDKFDVFFVVDPPK